MESQKSELTIKPIFYILLIATNLPLMFLAVWLTIMICGPLTSMGFMPIFAIPLVPIIFILLASLYLQYVYENTTYKIFNDKIIYTRNYIVFQKNSVVKLSEIREISNSQNIIQRVYGLGSVVLHTRITNESDVRIIDIKDYKKVADKLFILIFKPVTPHKNSSL